MDASQMPPQYFPDGGDGNDNDDDGDDDDVFDLDA